MYMAIKINTINEIDLRLNYNCPSINGSALRLDLYWYPQNGFKSPLKLHPYRAGIYSQMTTTVYKLITNSLGFLWSLMSLLLSVSLIAVQFLYFASIVPCLFYSRLNLILLPTYISKFCKSLFIVLSSILGFATPYNLVWSVNVINVMYANHHKEPSQLHSQKRKKETFIML